MKELFKIRSDFVPSGDQPQAIKKLMQGLEDGLSRQILLGVTGSGKTFTMANVIQQVRRPALIMAPNKTLAAQLYSEFKTFFPDNAVEYFVSYYDYYQPEAYVPASDTFIDKDASINEHIEQMRLSATKALIEREDAIIVATVSAIYGLGDPRAYLGMVLHLSCKEQCPQRKILKRLAEMQYVRTPSSLSRGQFRVHGDIIDIFPADSEKDAIRIELFDDEVDKITVFDPLIGTVIKKLPRITIFPKTHYVTSRERILETIELVKQELCERLQFYEKNNKLLEAQRLQQRTAFDIEMMMELGYCTGIENYSRYLAARAPNEPPPTLFDYLPPEALLIIDESHVTVPQITGMYKGDRARKETLVEYGFRLPSALDNRPLRFEEFNERAHQTIYISATPGPYELEHADQVAEQVIRPTGLLDPEVEIRPALNQVDDLLSEIHLSIASNHRVLVTTLTKKMSEDLTHYLKDQGIAVQYLHSDIDTMERVEIIRDLRAGVYDVLVGINLLREGLDMPEVALVAILDADKEGFLRSERALIQTIGRAARNLHGRAILYADRKTGSIEKAIQETLRRREKQANYNQMHGITPRGIEKAVHHMIEQEQITHPSDVFNMKDAELQYLDQAVLAKKIQKLEKEMTKLAQNMEFEKAAVVRDQLMAIKKHLMD